MAKGRKSHSRAHFWISDYHCEKIDIINGISLSLPFHKDSANNCPQGTTGIYDESLPIASCNMSQSIYWRKGAQVFY